MNTRLEEWLTTFKEKTSEVLYDDSGSIISRALLFLCSDVKWYFIISWIILLMIEVFTRELSFFSIQGFFLFLLAPIVLFPIFIFFAVILLLSECLSKQLTSLLFYEEYYKKGNMIDKLFVKLFLKNR